MKKGIDVSKHNGDINWKKVKPEIDFAMIRAGLGKNNIDIKFKQNANACTELNIPFGVYWFSYAYNKEMAKNEAIYCINAIKNYNLRYPVCFDFEYDSYEYARSKGKNLKPSEIKELCETFLSEIEKAGYYAMNYANTDYLKNYGMEGLTSRYDLWYGYPEKEKCNRSCGIWQYSFKGRIAGITGKVDLDYAFKDYPAMIAGSTEEKEIIRIEENEAIKNEFLKYFEEYRKVAEDVINGLYGNGEERKEQLKSIGYDPRIVQAIVNKAVG